MLPADSLSIIATLWGFVKGFGGNISNFAQGNGAQKGSGEKFLRCVLLAQDDTRDGLPHRPSTRHNVSFSASRKFHLCLGFSSPRKGEWPLRGPRFWSCPHNDGEAFGGSKPPPYEGLWGSGLPRQCAHWLAMTCVIGQRNDTE